jgi:hypothetical protein
MSLLPTKNGRTCLPCVIGGLSILTAFASLAYLVIAWGVG